MASGTGYYPSGFFAPTFWAANYWYELTVPFKPGDWLGWNPKWDVLGPNSDAFDVICMRDGSHPVEAARQGTYEVLEMNP